MKKANEYTQKDVKRRGLAILYSTQSILLNHNLRRFRLDMRYNFNKDLAAFIRQNALPENERQRVKELRRQRAKNKSPEYTRIFDLPIVKDWIKNKRRELKGISGDGLHFYGGRNHWAKNDKDRKILSILKKYKP